MPQDGSNNYQYPPGTPGIPDQTIESDAYNTFLDDLVVNDLNIPRPVHRGGTGGSNVTAALINLTGEKAAQLVTDYGSHVWMPGSFYSAPSATAAPVSGHAFAGICYINEPLVNPPTNANVTVSARDLSDTEVPSRVYARQKKAGVWDAAWSGLLTLSGDPTSDLHAVTKRYVDGGTGGLSAGKVDRAGDTMTGLLTLSGDPTAILHAATKQYVDGGVGGVGGGLAGKVAKAGDIMTGHLELPTGPAAANAVRKDYVDGLIAAIPGGPTQATAAEYIANSAPTKMLTSGATWGAAPATGLGASTSYALNLSNGIDFLLQPTASFTLANPTNVKLGQKGLIYIVPGIAGLVITFGSAWKFSGGTKPTVSATSGMVDILSYVVWDATPTMYCSYAPDFK